MKFKVNTYATNAWYCGKHIIDLGMIYNNNSYPING